MQERVNRRPVLIRPVGLEFRITQGFWEDNINHPVRGSFYKLFDNHHPGIDFETPFGTPVIAVFDGVVVRKEKHPGMGNVVGIRNGNIVSLYAHLGSFDVEIGEFVESGRLVGLSGNTGVAEITYPHLHFELRDITQHKLEEMVFEPKFGLPITQWKEQFFYKVNNVNTRKSLRFLSLRYFGSEKRWMDIKKANTSLESSKPDDIIQDGHEVLIPNFTYARK